MEIKNYDVCDKNYRQKNPMVPKHPFRMCLIGPSGSGKTNLLLNMIYNEWLAYDTITLVAKTLQQPTYQKLIETIHEAEGVKKRALERENKRRKKDEIMPDLLDESQWKIGHAFVDSIDDIPPLESYDPSKQNLLICDDCIEEKNQSAFLHWFIRSRHKNCSVLYLSQSYFKIPPDIRRNTSCFVLFKMPRQRDLSLIYDDQVSVDITKDQFKQIYFKATNPRYGFLVIDTMADCDKMFIRNKFDGIIL